ncbi:MAG: glycosyltransferase, partial [Micrococcales bacterium]|nr:glycosyltransferase [Micrococcales bacterium]
AAYGALSRPALQVRAALLRDRAWARGWRGRVATAVANAATRVARTADLVIVADEQVPPHTRERIVQRNLPDLSMLPEPGPRSGAPRALYVGDVRASRGLWSMIDAIAAVPQWQLDIVGPVAASDRERLARELECRGLAARVHLLGRQPPREAWRLARDAWCGLALLEDTPAFRDALPSKLYEYLASGLAVVVTDLPRQAVLATVSGAGEVVPAGPGAGAAAAAVLRSWSSRPDTIDARRSAARTWSAGLDNAPYAAVAARVRELLCQHPR